MRHNQMQLPASKVAPTPQKTLFDRLRTVHLSDQEFAVALERDKNALSYLWKLTNEVIAVRCASRTLDIRVRYVDTAQFNVVLYRRTEEHRFLTDDADLSSEPANVKLPNVNAVKLHLHCSKALPIPSILTSHSGGLSY